MLANKPIYNNNNTKFI